MFLLRILCLCLSLFVFFPHKVSAFDVSFLSEPLKGKAEYHYGIDSAEANVFGYGNLTISPYSGITQTGLRFRFGVGAGTYSYSGHAQIGDKAIPLTYSGSVTSAEFLIGYYKKIHTVDTKLFLGAHFSDHIVSPYDNSNAVQGDKLGLKLQLELWKNLSTKNWLSGNLSYTTGYDEYWLQVSTGYKILPEITIGLELATFGNQSYAASRLGLLGRYDTEYGELSLSAGITSNHDEDFEPYMGLSILRKF